MKPCVWYQTVPWSFSVEMVYVVQYVCDSLLRVSLAAPTNEPMKYFVYSVVLPAAAAFLHFCGLWSNFRLKTGDAIKLSQTIKHMYLYVDAK